MTTTIHPARKPKPAKKKHASDRSGQTPGVANNRDRFLAACRCEPLARPPGWLMRQAGRALPEYRELKLKHSFVEMVQTPELAAEVTLQPIRRFGFDAAILFSDILVLAEGLGQGYQFREQGGIQMDFLLESERDIARLEVEAVEQRLAYVPQTLQLLKTALKGETALLGFAGSPWTLANFMLEGGGVKEYTRARSLFYSDRALFDRLMAKLTEAASRFLKAQIQAGADAVQIFDSLGGLLSESTFAAASGDWIRQIVASLGGAAPVIVFSKGTHANWSDLANTGARVIGVDWNVSLSETAARLPANIAVQGNLDPFVLTTTPEIVAAETALLLEQMRGRPGYIFNLGHGVPPNARLECLESLVHTLRKVP